MIRRAILGLAVALCVTGANAQQAETVKIAFVDTLSGPFANVGMNTLHSWQFAAEHLSTAGMKFEVVGFDNKGSSQETLSAVRAASDQGFRYVAQANGSGPAAAIIDSLNKQNARNPGKEMLYLNFGAVDPALTNEQCSFWHFRFDADTVARMEVLAAYLKDKTSIKRVFLLNQNYAHGQQVARYFKEAIARTRPDVQIVGEDLHQIGLVKDFSPYVTKMKASGADALVTGNWGQDLTLLVKAINEAGLKIPMYTYFASSTGTPTALAAAGDGEVYVVSYAHSNPAAPVRGLIDEFRARTNEDFFPLAIVNALRMLGAAMTKAKSTDPVKVASALEGLQLDGFAGRIEMRASDHQLQQPLFIDRWQKAKQGEYSVEKTGYTFVPVATFDAKAASVPSTCQMKRP